MQIQYNGSELSIQLGQKLGTLLASQGIAPDAKGVAVAVDEVVIPRSQWPNTELQSGQSILVIQATQGG